MKTTFYILAIVVLFFFIARISITLNPFKVTFGSLPLAIGWVFTFIGISLIAYNHHRDRVKQGRNEVIEVIKELNKEEDETV